MFFDYYNEIFIILSTKMLKPRFKVAPTSENIKTESLWFYIKDEKFIDNLVKVREKDRLYFSMPVISAQSCRNILQSHLRVCNRIFESIMKKVTPPSDINLGKEGM